MKHPDTALRAVIAVGLLAFVGLPWFALPDGSWYEVLTQVGSVPESANGWVQAWGLGRLSIGWALGGLLLASLALRCAPGRVQGAWLMLGGLLGCVGVLWPQPVGVGAGALVMCAALVVLWAFGLARWGAFRGDLMVSACVVACAVLLLVFIGYPVVKAMGGALLDDAHHLSWAALQERVGSERVWGLGCLQGGVRCGVAWNTLWLALCTALGTTVLGTALALLSERMVARHAGAARWRVLLRLLSVLPIITPPFVVGLGLILLFGRAGLVNQALEWAFDIAPTRWLYGALGIWLAQMFAFTPIAYLMMRGVVQGVSPSLEEAAQTLRADRQQVFMHITLPLLKPGLANAFLVGFIESMADFGNPIVVGGQYAVLSTDIFFAIVGAQFDQGRAAALAWLLTAFALCAFALQRLLVSRQRFTTVSGKGDAGLPMALPQGLHRAIQAVALPWLGFTAVIYLFAALGGFVKTWGRDYTPTLQHFKTAFEVEWGTFGLVWAGTAWNSLWTTLKLAGLSAPLTAGLGLLMAWLLARNKFKGQGAFEFAALLAFAIPGTVLGVSYILAFNVPPLELTGTGTIIVLCFMFRNLPVGVRAGTAAFEQLDRSLDEAATMLRASTWQTVWHVVLPLLKPALVAALVYSFVRAMTTVSAVIFLVTAENELATSYIIGRVGNGDYGVALAYCTVLMLCMAAAVGFIQWVVGERQLGRRT